MFLAVGEITDQQERTVTQFVDILPYLI